MKIKTITTFVAIVAGSAAFASAAATQSNFDAKPMNAGPPNMMMMPMGHMMQPMSDYSSQPMEKPMMKKHMSKMMMKKKMMKDGAGQ